MGNWKPGDRVEHQTLGSGTVLECNEQHTVVHFDHQGRRRLANSVAVLTESKTSDPHASRRSERGLVR
jgi:hypothetical protein